MTDGSTAAAEKEQTLVIQDGWEAELKNDKLVLISFVFLNISPRSKKVCIYFSLKRLVFNSWGLEVLLSK